MLTTSFGALVRLFLGGLLLGAAFGVVYDALRITRVLMGVRYSRAETAALTLPMPNQNRLVRQHRVGRALRDIIVDLEDICFFLVAGSSMAIYLSAANHGRVRWFAFVGAAMGFIVYYFTVGRVVVRFSEAIASLLRFAVAWLWWLFCLPIGWLARGVCWLVRRIWCRLRRIWLWLYLPGYTRRAMRRYLGQINRVFAKAQTEG